MQIIPSYVFVICNNDVATVYVSVQVNMMFSSVSLSQILPSKSEVHHFIWCIHSNEKCGFVCKNVCLMSHGSSFGNQANFSVTSSWSISPLKFLIILHSLVIFFLVNRTVICINKIAPVVGAPVHLFSLSSWSQSNAVLKFEWNILSESL